MKSSFSSLLKDDKGTKYKPQSLVELINKNKNSKKGSSISQQQQQHEQKLLAFIGKDLLSMSNNTNNSKNLFGSNTTTNKLIGSPSANNNINSITTGEPNRLFSKMFESFLRRRVSAQKVPRCCNCPALRCKKNCGQQKAQTGVSRDEQLYCSSLCS